jgi:hypothetical protein
MATTKGLPDDIRGHLGLAATLILVAQTYLLGSSVAGAPVVPPTVIWVVGLAAAVLVAARDYGGVRDASTARVARETNPSLQQYRDIPKQRV